MKAEDSDCAEMKSITVLIYIPSYIILRRLFWTMYGHKSLPMEEVLHSIYMERMEAFFPVKESSEENLSEFEG